MSEEVTDTTPENNDATASLFDEPQTQDNPQSTGAEGGSSTPSGNPPQQNPAGTADNPPASGSDVPQPVSAEDLARATAEAVTKSLQQQQQQNKETPPQRGMTQQEYNDFFKRTVVNNDSVEKLLNPDTPVAEKVQLLQGLLDGVANHAVLRAKYITDYEVKRLVDAYQAEMAPFKQEYSARQTAAAKETFLKAYPGFDLKSHKDILGAATMAVNKDVQTMPADKRNALTEAQVMELVAEKAANIIRQVNPNFNPKAGPEGTTPVSNGTSSVPSATTKSFPAGAKVNPTKTNNNQNVKDAIDDLFEESE